MLRYHHTAGNGKVVMVGNVISKSNGIILNF